MKTKLVKIGMITTALIFILVGSTWAKNKQHQRKHKKNYNKQTYEVNHVKRNHNGARPLEYNHRKGHHFRRPGHKAKRHWRHHRHDHRWPWHYHRYHHHWKHHRRWDHHHSQNDYVIIGSIIKVRVEN